MWYFKQGKARDVQSPAAPDAETAYTAVYPTYDENLSVLEAMYEDCGDTRLHSFLAAGDVRVTVIYTQGITDEQLLERFILTPLLHTDELLPSAATLLSRLPTTSAASLEHWPDVTDHIGNGNPVLLIDGEPRLFTYGGMTRVEQRGVEEPVAESTVRGPREGFTESLGVNIPLLRRRLKSPNLKMQHMTIGAYSKTQVTLVYIKGIAAPSLIEEMKSRIARIRLDGVLESETIEEWISDNPYSPFPQMLPTERPDVVCANLLEGRAALLVDGTPFALIAPVSLFSMLQSPEDYYQNIMMSTFIRWLRYVFFVMSLLLPSAYVAITTYHQEMIPTVLLLNIAKSREEIPFPALVEALIMEITFEALREAGVRLPKQVGAAVSIVGALVIGQAATSAGIVSAPMVIVVAITGIASFMIPRYALGIPMRLIRFPVMLLAGTLGLVGVMLGFIGIVIHLCRLYSFGLPYLSPLAPVRFRELRDTLIRTPMWKQAHRPKLSGYGDHPVEPETEERNERSSP
ncbi:spore germination protein [Paenibacillus sp. y28]|uniref:spore germination protein n=1 Tax=Paenibacillus sp. y28 TaxID=3129110 RepID=UPI003018E67C